jgi:hypothetical protein
MRKRMYEYQAKLRKQKLVTTTLRQRIRDRLTWRTSTPLSLADTVNEATNGDPSESRDKILTIYRQLPLSEFGVLAAAQGCDFYSSFVTSAYAEDRHEKKEDLIQDLQVASVNSNITLEEALITYNIKYPHVREWLLTSELQRYETKREAYRVRVLSFIDHLTHLEEIYMMIKDVLYRAKPNPEESQRIIKKQSHLITMEAERCYDLEDDPIDCLETNKPVEPIKVLLILLHDQPELLQQQIDTEQKESGKISIAALQECALTKKTVYDGIKSLSPNTLIPYNICWIVWQYLFHPSMLYPHYPFTTLEDSGFELIN